ncbi:MAG: hypothetical protein J6W09_08035 [Bacteroidales bacterium]|nr:hypothetical protein [Bacteroidales bacterium]
MKKSFIFAALALVLFVSCGKNKPDRPRDDDPDDIETPASITIDGEFDDWAALDQSKVKIARNNPESPWEAVKQISVYADKDFVYYYIEYDAESLADLLGANDPLHIRLCINTDGEFTSGYSSYFLQAYDFIIEGALGNEAGGWKDFDGTLHQRVGGEWKTLLEPGHSLVSGKGKSNMYEIQLIREVFNGAVASSETPNSPMGDVFHTGVRFYGPAWAELSNLPNSSAEEGDGKGWGNLLEVTTSK